MVEPASCTTRRMPSGTPGVATRGLPDPLAVLLPARIERAHPARSKRNDAMHRLRAAGCGLLAAREAKTRELCEADTGQRNLTHIKQDRGWETYNRIPVCIEGARNVFE